MVILGKFPGSSIGFVQHFPSCYSNSEDRIQGPKYIHHKLCIVLFLQWSTKQKWFSQLQVWLGGFLLLCFICFTVVQCFFWGGGLVLLVSHLRLSQRKYETVAGWLNHFIVITQQQYQSFPVWWLCTDRMVVWDGRTGYINNAINKKNRS